MMQKPNKPPKKIGGKKAIIKKLKKNKKIKKNNNCKEFRIDNIRGKTLKGKLRDITNSFINHKLLKNKFDNINDENNNCFNDSTDYVFNTRKNFLFSSSARIKQKDLLNQINDVIMNEEPNNLLTKIKDDLKIKDTTELQTIWIEEKNNKNKKYK